MRKQKILQMLYDELEDAKDYMEKEHLKNTIYNLLLAKWRKEL